MGQKSFHTPIGEITLSAEDFGEGMALISVDSGWGRDQENAEPFLKAAAEAFQDYFDGKRQDFSEIAILPLGTAFQKKVWAELVKIPYGETVTYGALAEKLQTSPRAVGNAVGVNPLPIIIPCHRVLPKSGRVGEYSFAEGSETKRFLLNLERHFSRK